MSTPIYVNNGGVGVTTGSSYTPGLPSGVSVGDLLILEVVLGISGAVVPTPSGWTPIMNQYYALRTNSFAVFYQVYAGGSAPTITGGTYIAAVISRFTGARTTTPIGAIGTFNTGQTPTITSSGLTTTAANSLVALACIIPNNISAAFTNPSGWTSDVDLWIGTVGDEFIITTQALASSGSSSGSTSTLDSNFYNTNNFNWYSIQFEILAILPPCWVYHIGDKCAVTVMDHTAVTMN